MNRIRRNCALLLSFMLILGLVIMLGIGGVFAQNEEDATAVDPNDYIYFDLAAGNVEISSTSYSGAVYVKGEIKPVTGDHKADNKYYVYQSNTDKDSPGYYENTGYDNTGDYNDTKNCHVPDYKRVSYDGKPWREYITNNTEVKTVSTNWEKAAEDSDRKSTINKINFATESYYSVDMTVDNIWSSYHPNSTSRTNGGIGAHLDNMKGTSIQLRLKGDNRVGCVHYSSDLGSGNQIIFSNGDDNSTPGSITVADFPNQWGYNHWNAVIGAADSKPFDADMSEGIVINGGVIFAGSTPEDNCTAIGGGGNNYGSVTINGGTVTAVASTTGTAIGGGIGYGDVGGDTDVIINKGIVYAYNLGVQKGIGDNFTKFVPAAAIGGGSSHGSRGNNRTNVTITGGKVYAQCMGGAAIGGGGGANGTGGHANINISGGEIIAKSTEGTYGTETITAGVSIGGGTGKTGGGSVELNISGGILRTGSIGGGKTTGTGNIGHANVKITGGNMVGQVIMAGGAANPCTFEMSDGEIHSADVINGHTVTDLDDPQGDIPITYIEDNGGAVWMDDPKGVTNISGGTIRNCSAQKGGAIYMTGGKFTMSGTGRI